MDLVEFKLRTWKQTLVERSRDDRGDIVQYVVIIAAFVIAVMFGGSILFKATVGAGKAAGDKEGADTTPPPEETVPEPVTPAPEIDWSITLNVLAIVGISAAVLIGGYIAFRVLRDSVNNHSAKKTQLESMKRRRDHAIASIADSELTQARWEMDPAILIDYPEFSNYSAEPVSALSKAYKVAVLHRDEFSHLGDKFTEGQLATLEDNATNLSLKLHAAQEYAKSVGWGRISFAEKKLMERAKDLIAVASNEAVNEHERAAALRGLQGVLNSLRDDHGRVINTDKLNQAIEAKANPKELTMMKPTMTVEPFAVKGAIAL